MKKSFLESNKSAKEWVLKESSLKVQRTSFPLDKNYIIEIVDQRTDIYNDLVKNNIFNLDNKELYKQADEKGFHALLLKKNNKNVFFLGVGSTEKGAVIDLLKNYVEKVVLNQIMKNLDGYTYDFNN